MSTTREEKGEALPDAPTLADVLLGDTSEGDVLDESEFAYNGGNEAGDESDNEFEYDEDDDDD